ncbi:MAG: dihydroorotate dehydrogenase, partial [Actinomycetota bacterium]
RSDGSRSARPRRRAGGGDGTWRRRRPGTRRRCSRAAPRFASIADESRDDVVATFRLLAPHVDAVELNASCPNVTWGRDRDNEAHLRDLLSALRERAVPLFVKLPPFRTDVEREVVLALARIAQESGADGLTCSNTAPVDEPRLSVGRGGLSGAALAAMTPRIVEAVREATGGALPINACGGIASVDAARACLGAGATTVQVYTGLLHEGPRLASRLARGLAAR